MAGTSFRDVRAAAAAQSEAFCRHYLPRGKRSGDWWIAPVPWREDKHPSLGVNLKLGTWSDFGRPGDFGDLIDFLKRLKSLDTLAAKDELSRLLGLDL